MELQAPGLTRNARRTTYVTMTDTVSITPRAATRIKDIIAAEPGATALRVAVEGGGCSGFQYDFKLDSQRAEDDLVIERDGATVLIDSVSLVYMGGSEIDFVDEMIGAAFKVKNPNATASCGCGTSFSV